MCGVRRKKQSDKKTSNLQTNNGTQNSQAQSAGVVEYTACISVEG